MISKIIHHTSFNPTWEERRIMARTEKMMPDFEHRFWDDEMNLALFERCFPQHLDAYKGFAEGVVRADISRCLYLHEFGGIYVDTDYKFYRRLDDAFLSNRCVLGIEEENNNAVGGGKKLGNAFMASEKGFGLWADFIENIFFRRKQGEDRVLQLSGPHALTVFIRESNKYEDLITLMPARVIYPDFTMMKLSTYRDSETIGAHLCWGSWRNKKALQLAKSRGRRILTAIF